MEHSKRVSKLSKELAEKMGYSKERTQAIETAGLLHDIGKIAIDSKLLYKTEKLTTEEYNEIKRHVEIGYRILNSVNELAYISDFVLQHHEQWDGNGYPIGLKGEEILEGARIICVCDTYDAIISKRSYKDPQSKNYAVDEIKKFSGIMFDPRIAKIFIEEVLKEKW